MTERKRVRQKSERGGSPQKEGCERRLLQSRKYPKKKKERRRSRQKKGGQMNTNSGRRREVRQKERIGETLSNNGPRERTSNREGMSLQDSFLPTKLLPIRRPVNTETLKTLSNSLIRPHATLVDHFTTFCSQGCELDDVTHRQRGPLECQCLVAMTQCSREIVQVECRSSFMLKSLMIVSASFLLQLDNQNHENTSTCTQLFLGVLCLLVEFREPSCLFDTTRLCFTCIRTA